MIGDTEDDLEFLSDPEIHYFIAEEPTVRLAAARAALAIAARVAKDTDYRFSTLWQDAGMAYDHFVNLAEKLAGDEIEDLDGIAFTSPISGKDDCALGEPQFRIGMHDDPQGRLTHDITPCD